MFANEEIQNLLAALGIPVPLKGKKKSDKEILEKLRYNKIIIMTGKYYYNFFFIFLIFVSLIDADVDGAHIRLLLLALLYHVSPSLFEEKKVFLALPPLYKISFARNKDNKKINNNQIEEFFSNKDEDKNTQIIDMSSLNLEALGLDNIELNEDELRLMGLLPKKNNVEIKKDDIEEEILINKDYYIYDNEK